MSEKDVLELKTRRRIYNHILESPGLYERDISRRLNIPLSTLDYHLYYLKKRGLITDRSDGRFTRYYIVGDIGVKDKKVIAVLRQNVFRKIIIFLLLRSHSFHREICNHIGLAPSTTSFHLNKLVDLDVIDRIQIGRETRYSIRESEYVSDLLVTYRRSFFDDAVDRFVDTWLELHPRHLSKSRKKRKEINLLSLF